MGFLNVIEWSSVSGSMWQRGNKQKGAKEGKSEGKSEGFNKIFELVIFKYFVVIW